MGQTRLGAFKFLIKELLHQLSMDETDYYLNPAAWPKDYGPEDKAQGNLDALLYLFFGDGK